MRSWFLKVHRWSGLFLAAFLAVAGLTGACLAYHDELQALLIPHWAKVEPRGSAMSPFEFARIAEALEPRATVDVVALSREPGESAVVSLSPRINSETGSPHHLEFDQVFVDPYTGRVLGKRLWGAVRFDAPHLMPMLYRMHYSLMLGGVGAWLFGVVALVWLVNCLIGFYLGLPAQKRNFFKVWRRSWLVRATAPVSRFAFDLHRAAGLWVWAVLLVFALSAVQFNLYGQVFRPVLAALLPFEDPVGKVHRQTEADSRPPMSWEAAHERGRALMAKHAAEQGFALFEEVHLIADHELHTFTYVVRSSLDIREKGGQTRVLFGGTDGRELRFFHPSMTSGNTFASWLSALHMRRVWGAPYQAFVALLGLIVVTLSVTGVMVWIRRRPVTRPSSSARAFWTETMRM